MPNKKRIGIVTILKCNNYGAELQAFGLQRAMNLMGYDAEILDYLFYKHKDHVREACSKPFYNYPFKQAIKERLLDYFNTILKDNVKARVQGADGIYRKKEREPGAEPLDSQNYFYRQAYKAAEEKLAAKKKKKKGFFAKIKEKFSK